MNDTISMNDIIRPKLHMPRALLAFSQQPHRMTRPDLPVRPIAQDLRRLVAGMID